MKPSQMHYDNQQTYELKTYEVTLTCGACGEGKFISVEGAPEVDAVHACTHCGRELAVEGLPYPRAEVKRVLAAERIIETPVPVDPNAPPEKLSAYEVGFMLPAAHMDLLRTTLDVEMVEIIQKMSQDILFAPALTSLRERLYLMAGELAEMRALVEMPADYNPFTEEAETPYIETMVHQLVMTRNPVVIDHVKRATVYRLKTLPNVRKALFDVAR